LPADGGVVSKEGTLSQGDEIVLLNHQVSLSAENHVHLDGYCRARESLYCLLPVVEHLTNRSADWRFWQAEFDRMDLTSANLELIVLKADMGDMGQSVETMQSLLADISRVEEAAEEDESEVSITCSQNNVK